MSTMRNRTISRTHSKAKISFTLSQMSVKFLEERKNRRHASSLSAVLEEIVQEAKRGERQKTIDRAVTDYYDSLSEKEIEEQREWGEFALTQFPGE